MELDRVFHYKFGSNSGGGRRGGCAPPHPPAFQGAPTHRTPQKGAPRPWPQRLFAFSRPRHLSGADSLPGAELVLKFLPFFEEEATCPGQLRRPGQNFTSQIRFLLNKPLVLGSFAAWGRTFLKTWILFLNKPLVLGSCAARGRFVFSKGGLFA